MNIKPYMISTKPETVGSLEWEYLSDQEELKERIATNEEVTRLLTELSGWYIAAIELLRQSGIKHRICENAADETAWALFKLGEEREYLRDALEALEYDWSKSK